MSKCAECELWETCENYEQVNFCEDCRDFPDCSICTVTCEAGHFIECNNGFEEEGYCDEYDEEDDNGFEEEGYCDEYDEEDDEDDAGESNA